MNSMHYRTIVEESTDNLVVMDVFSKLIQDRIIFIDDVITPNMANTVMAQLLHLDSLEKKEINIYINSPGGDIFAGLAIYDIAKIIKSPIRTLGVGLAASMAAILMLMGDVRASLPHTRYMLHEASGFVYGRTSEAKISLKVQEEAQEDLYKIIREKTSFENVDELFQLDRWYTPQEAKKYGLVTEIL